MVELEDGQVVLGREQAEIQGCELLTWIVKETGTHLI